MLTKTNLRIRVRGKIECLTVFALILLLPLGSVRAAPFDPIVDLWRLDARDRLVIDRGGPVDAAGDVNGDGYEDLLVGSGVGGIRVVFGPTKGDNGVLNGQQLNGIIGFTIVHDSDNISHVSAAGDVNNDGLDDVLVGSLGGVHVVFGSRERFPAIFDVSRINGRNGFSVDVSATAVSDAGDVNDDGIDDIIIGSANASINHLTGVGAAYVVYGKPSGFPAKLTTAQISGVNGFAIIGAQQQDRLGYSVAAAGDFNHDGVDDLLLGAANKTQQEKPEAGEAYVVFGQSIGHPSTISVADLNAGTGLVIRGTDNQNATGASVAGIGDLNHDGIDDIAIGAPGKGPFGSPSDYPGEIYILFGGEFLGVSSIDRSALNGVNGVRVRGIRGGVVPIEEGEAIWGDLAGVSLDGIEDFNGDGIDDLLIGASHTIINPSRKGVGQTYVIHGTKAAFPAHFSLRDLDGSNGFRINGIGTADYYGVYTRSAGDFDDDGLADFIAGASGEGASYLIYGRNFDNGVLPAAIAPPLNAEPPLMPAAARLVGVDAPRLSFNELADPLGPNPLPEGTLTDLNDPNTPGYIPPNVFAPVAVLRPQDVPSVTPNPELELEDPQTDPEVTPQAEPEISPVDNPVVDPESTPTPGTPPTDAPEPAPVNPSLPTEPLADAPAPDTEPNANQVLVGRIDGFLALLLVFVMVSRVTLFLYKK